MGSERACPFCAETIQAGAKKCRHCGEWLEGGAARGRKRTCWQGSNLMAHDGAFVEGDACMICGGDQQVLPAKRQFIYTPWWAYLGLLGGLIPLVILVLIGRKIANITLPLCKRCNFRWKLADGLLLLFILVGLFGLPFLFGALGHKIARDDGVVVGIIFGFVALVGGAAAIKLLWCNRVQVRCTYIEEGRATLVPPDEDIARRALGASDG